MFLFLFLTATLFCSVELVSLDLQSLSGYPMALCNDGTSAVYYKENLQTLSSGKVVIYLEGGGGCTTPAECAERCLINNPHLCTASTKTNITKSERMWSEDKVENPPFYDYQKVYVPYCSSDVYSGSRNYSDGLLSMIFHGRYIVEAIVQDIMPTLITAKSVVLMGGSAGAFGTSLNCDFVADLIHSQNSEVDVRCIGDAGDFYPYWVHQEGCTVDQVGEQLTKFWGAQGDLSCIQENDEIFCGVFGRYYQYIETPFMAITSFEDTNAQVHPCAPVYPEDPEFWEQWRKEMQLFAFNYTQEKPGNGIFLVNCPLHVLATKDYAWAEMWIGVEGEELVLKDAINNWITANGQPFQAIDAYNSMNEKCPKFTASGSNSNSYIYSFGSAVIAVTLASLHY